MTDLFNQPSGTFFNTTAQRGTKLLNSRQKADRQEDAVLALFRDKKSLSAGQAWQILAAANDRQWLIGSVRRAISVLAVKGKLEKTPQMVRGLYDDNEHVYRLIE